jgi:hypothetical protein
VCISSIIVNAKDRERLSARKQAAQKTDVERFNLKSLTEIEVRKQFQIEISNRFEALENLNDSENVNKVWKNMKENIQGGSNMTGTNCDLFTNKSSRSYLNHLVQVSAKETLGLYRQKQHKPWFDEECSQVLSQRKHAKMQWLKDPNQSN